MSKMLNEIKDNSKTGLTMIEVMFALSILTVVLLGLGTALQQSVSINSSSKTRTFAYNDAKKIMEKVRAIADTNGIAGDNTVTDSAFWASWISGQSFSALPQPVSRVVSFPSGTTETDGTAKDPVHVRVAISWQEKNAQQEYRIDTLITQRFWQS